MTKGKSLNPADAQRKAERKKELKKNKAERQKARDFSLVKKDTTDIEEEIQRLEKAETDQTITPAQRTQLPALRAELKRINKKKEDYVAEHPEHRKLVFRAPRTKTEETAGVEGEGKKKERKVFDKNGIPRHPERSIYYDPVMNPFGVPPPGMPYMERPLRPDEVDSQAEDSDEEPGSDNDITMPSGPPPTSKDVQPGGDSGEQDSDDDIPMPEGPPPSQVQPPLPPLPPPPNVFPPSYPNASLPFAPNFPPPPPPGFSGSPQTGFAPPVPGGFPNPSVPPPPLGFPAVPPPPPPPGFPVPPPPLGFPAVPPPPPPGFPPHPAGRSFFPPRPRIQSDASIQDPLSFAPHQTFQAYRANQAQLSHPLPEKPTSVANSSSTVSTQPATTSSGGTISAPAQLRDLKKESTAFMPSSLKRKKPGGAASSSGGRRINAAPIANNTDDEGAAGEGEPAPARPDLLGTLQSNFPAPASRPNVGHGTGMLQTKSDLSAKRDKDDYEKFMEEIDDIL